jgi:hypothetical protein
VSPVSRLAQVAFRNSVAMGPCVRRDDMVINLNSSRVNAR